ncbi:hypothetical protein NPIL_586881 [Nephila pilipes]|uniref:Uncharacterized protein n=1 Tax=Nephila pilipes TaxID=299642 RepID=A0A8X6P9B5_NEPPI|nr:hypothetical protein NPIL_586881 [Nephila pilipes]
MHSNRHIKHFDLRSRLDDVEKQTIRNLHDYQAGAIEVTDGRLKKPDLIDVDEEKWILLIGNNKSYEKLTVRLCTFIRNLTKATDCNKGAKETLVALKLERHRHDGKRLELLGMRLVALAKGTVKVKATIHRKGQKALKNVWSSNSGWRKSDGKSLDFIYIKAVGVLMYLMVETRLDLDHSVEFLSRSLENLSAKDIVRVKGVFCDKVGSFKYGITYHAAVTKGLHCDSDSELSGCIKTC